MSAPEAPFENKDTNIRRLAALIALFLILLGGTFLITRLLDRHFRRASTRSREMPSPLAQLHQLPPEPRLQVNPAVDLIRLRDVENVTLNNYAWVDPVQGIVRIPVARAMAILAERGLPSRPAQEEKSE